MFVRMRQRVIHRNENVILTKFSSLAALEVVILTTSSDENVVVKISSKCRHFRFNDIGTSTHNIHRPQKVYEH